MLRTDSRKVRPGDTFVAVNGITHNGSDYIEDAIENGASLIVCSSGSYSIPTVNVPDTEIYLEDVLTAEYGDLISSMTLMGVTGTNGKTTTCFLVSQALNLLGIRCAYIGTVGFYLDDKICDLPNTSIDLCSLYELLVESHNRGFDHVIMEASSQGLDMGRLNTITFDAAVFTNLTEDHLDYHKTMHNYAMAKKILFDSLKADGTAIVNADDPAGAYYVRDDRRVLTYGMAKNGNRPDISVISYNREDDVTDAVFAYNGSEFSLKTVLAGEYNMYNLAAMTAVLISAGVSPDVLPEISLELIPPEGRMDRITYRGNDIIIDYAHTPDAFEKIFSTAREMNRNHIYTVFGCTGDREREKRPVMTRIALESSDLCVITVDDIHGEDPDQIFSDMLSGVLYDNYLVCPDRREAIKKGMELLEEGDVLLILGKGHEQFIVSDKGNIKHNDKQAVLDLIAEEI